MARELKRRGFRFVGPTTAYALMQACGLVDDHLEDCLVTFRHLKIGRLGPSPACKAEICCVERPFFGCTARFIRVNIAVEFVRAARG
jgi:hypothetical protein